MNTITFTGHINRFAMEGGWYYVEIPETYSVLFENGARGFTKVLATIEPLQWQTSVMPLGKFSQTNAKYFVAIKKEVRLRLGIGIGDEIIVTIQLID